MHLAPPPARSLTAQPPPATRHVPHPCRQLSPFDHEVVQEIQHLRDQAKRKLPPGAPTADSEASAAPTTPSMERKITKNRGFVPAYDPRSRCVSECVYVGGWVPPGGDEAWSGVPSEQHRGKGGRMWRFLVRKQGGVGWDGAAGVLVHPWHCCSVHSSPGASVGGVSHAKHLRWPPPKGHHWMDPSSGPT